MRALGPFEDRPLLAVGVSGGADSIALTLLADDWARARGGRAIGLTVDHGLRAASLEEARKVGEWLDVRGIEHHVFNWRPETTPETGIQALAREARRSLLTDWCRQHGVLHLLLAHHRDDQLETVAMREKRAPTGAGLAGMSGIVEGADIRILRPLLPIAGRDIEEMLRALEQPWIDDPSNRDRRFERVRVRETLQSETDDARAERIRRIRQAGEARATSDDVAARLVGQAISLHPAGFARIDRAAFRMVDTSLAVSVLGRIVRTISGDGYTSRASALQALAGRLTGDAAFAGSTLGGCRLIGGGACILVCREPAAISGDTSIQPGETVVWDRRFRVRLNSVASGSCRIAALGEEGWRQVKPAVPPETASRLPHAVRLGLPALKDNHGVIEVPHLTYGGGNPHAQGGWIEKIAPVVQETMTNARFFIASGRE